MNDAIKLQEVDYEGNIYFAGVTEVDGKTILVKRGPANPKQYVRAEITKKLKDFKVGAGKDIAVSDLDPQQEAELAIARVNSQTASKVAVDELIARKYDELSQG